MAHSKSAKKRIRQSAKANDRNRAKKSELRTHSKKVLAAIEAGDKAAAETALRLAMQKLDKAAKARVMHPNTVARRKSQLAKKVGALAGSK